MIPAGFDFVVNPRGSATDREFQQLRAELGVAVGDPASAIMQCGSGVTACHNLLALEVATRYDDGREFRTGVFQV